MFSPRDLSKEERNEFWQMVILDYKESGLTKSEYCERNDMALSSLSYWERRLESCERKEVAEGRFVEIPIKSVISDTKDIGTSKTLSPDFIPDAIIEYNGVIISLSSSAPVWWVCEIIKGVGNAQ